MRIDGNCCKCNEEVVSTAKGKRYVEIDNKKYCLDCRFQYVSQKLVKEE